MTDIYREFPTGSLVIVTRGKCAGTLCVVVGIDENTANSGKILIADGRKISASKPKRKNAKHVKSAGAFSAEIAGLLARGKKLNDGWLIEAIARSLK